MIVLLDSAVLGRICHSDSTSPETIACNRWLDGMLAARHTVYIPEICDYEIRRNLILEKLQKSLDNLDRLRQVLRYLPLNTETMLVAAELWAQARAAGAATAHDESLDADMILCAQARVGIKYGSSIVVATSNVRHISRFATAKHWRHIAAN